MLAVAPTPMLSQISPVHSTHKLIWSLYGVSLSSIGVVPLPASVTTVLVGPAEGADPGASNGSARWKGRTCSSFSRTDWQQRVCYVIVVSCYVRQKCLSLHAGLCSELRLCMIKHMDQCGASSSSC